MQFFFDDVRDPPDTEGWVLARDVPQAKEILSKGIHFEFMALDHDIGFAMMCEHCQDELHPVEVALAMKIKKLEEGCQHNLTGTHLAQWMADNLKEWPLIIVIHSHNPYGAERMATILRKANPAVTVRVAPYETGMYR